MNMGNTNAAINNVKNRLVMMKAYKDVVKKQKLKQAETKVCKIPTILDLKFNDRQ